MGRWAQRKIRGGGGEGGAQLPLVLISVELIAADSLKLTWSRAVEVDQGVVPDGGFKVNGIQPDNCSPFDSAVTTFAAADGAGWVDGDAWNLAAQPNWLLTPIGGPQTGTVTS